MSVRWVEAAPDVSELAARVVDPSRELAVVCVTTQPYLQRPMLDVDSLAARVGEAELWVVTRPHHGWQLTEALPPDLDVYGGATRIWWPIPSVDATDPRDHPIFTIFTPDDSASVSDAIIRALQREQVAAPSVGDDVDATVTRLFAHGAEMEFATGHTGFAANAHLASGPVYHAREVVQAGQAVRVRVSSAPRAGRGSFMVSLRPFSPDPWQRVGEVYGAGMDVEGVVVGFAAFGAFVELLPGAQGLLPNNRISSDFVHDARDYLGDDDRVVVRIRSLDVGAQRAELSLTEVPHDPQPEAVPSLYVGGPPWLLPVEEDVLPEEALVVDVGAPVASPPASDVAEPADADPVASVVPVSKDDGSLVETAPEASDTPQTVVVPPPDLEPEPARRAREDENADELSPVGPAVADDVSILLDAAVAEAEATRGELADAVAAGERRLVSLRAQAHAIARDLRQEVAAAEMRVLSVAQDESETVLAEAQHEIDALREHADGLRERLRAAERDRSQLIGQVRHATERQAASERRVAGAEADTRAARDDADRLRDQLDLVDGSDPGRRLVREIHHAWTTSYTSAHDRATYPFREPAIGPAFVDSIGSTPGVSRERILEVCAHVIAGRAHEFAGLKLHQLRDGDGGSAPPRVRDDGATAWRVNPQTGTASARRLHYWQLRDGRVELSKVGVHDDFTIV